jgi:hypothetical protein
MSAGTTVEKYGATVTVVDVPNKVIEFALKTGTTRRLTLATYPDTFTWPQVGDQIMVRYENGQWNLEGWFDPEGLYLQANPGDAVIHAATGTVHVAGDTSYNITAARLLPAQAYNLSGSKSGNAALANLIAILAEMGIVIDLTT